MNTGATRHWLGPHLRGHLLLFERGPVASEIARAGSRLLLAAVVLEIVRLAAVRWLYPSIPLWVLLPVLLAFALVALPRVAGVTLVQLGLRPWRDWSVTEKSYFLQVLVIANVVFPIVLAAQIRNRLAQSDMVASLWTVFVPYLFFGFYQELVYRGAIQTALVHRWGASIGITLANALYTFGPLHWTYFASRASVAVPMFAAIFAIGLYFGVLFRRSGNLWLVACFHAVGNAYIVWSMGSMR